MVIENLLLLKFNKTVIHIDQRKANLLPHN
jgi:hypothetical protein